MVQLKYDKSDPRYPKDPEFQFLYGTIKIIDRNVSNKSKRNFNSSMVQLKSVGLSVFTVVVPSFQFLYGTIKINY